MAPESPYLTTEEAAAYLRMGARKLYDLAAEGVAPCAKVTGKWLFPRAALDRWVEAGMSADAAPAPPPPIVAGSHDPLLEWALRRATTGLALLCEGSAAGLDRLERGEAAMAAIHLHDPGVGARTDADADAEANARALTRSRLADAVLIAFARREQGLLVAPGDPLRLGAGGDPLARALESKARFGLRQSGAGAQLLLERLLARAGARPADLAAAQAPYATGGDLAAAIRAGEADCGLASRSAAQGMGLGFAPLVWERFDLALRRRDYFEPGPQALFALARTGEFAAQAARLGGYDLAETGRVRLNR
jgi:excisionase family DNA binding protein